eukprot:GHUV01016713.1.p1 GENE.GHUV01016713.1~~GHUV01016713.1.p1  ORF type:complete len:443 (+),score=77.35 GHUV01016713.1:1134-2462(+)
MVLARHCCTREAFTRNARVPGSHVCILGHSAAPYKYQLCYCDRGTPQRLSCSSSQASSGNAQPHDMPIVQSRSSTYASQGHTMHKTQKAIAGATPSLQTAGCRSSRSVNARVAVCSSHNGQNGHLTVQLDRPAPIPLTLHQQPAPEVQQLQESVQQLMSTVKAQQKALQQQQTTIQQLQDTLQQIQRPKAGSTAPPAIERRFQRQSSGEFVWDSSIRPFEAQKAALWDRRDRGLYDARYHSTSIGATPPDRRVLPDRLVLVRHAQSEGNVDAGTYTYIPDPQVPLTGLGVQQAHEAGAAIRQHMEAAKRGTNYKLYFYTSPYKRSLQTYEGIRDAFASQQVLGMQEEVQLREQDFGNFQDAAGKEREKAERLRFGRFFYRFPNGESGADVYDRITVFQDHLIRDINAGRFANNTSLVLVTHGLALRIFLMRWFHWSVDQVRI